MEVNPRIMRLNADYEKLKTEFVGHKYVKVEPVGTTMPPERYRVTYKVPGVRWDRVGNRPIVVNEHVAEIYLHADYPREKPKCVLLTPIWHPNFGSYICIGDHWAAGETLVDVIVQIGDMIQYKNYNPKSPLNAQAAIWSIHNKQMFPVGRINLLQPEPDIDISGGPQTRSASEDDDLGIVLGPSPAKDDLEIELI